MLVLYVPQLILLNSSLENVGFAVRALSSLASLWTMAALVPNLALSVRRLHDTNRSGGWLALGIGVSAAGSIVMFAGFVVAVFNMVSSIDSMTDQEILRYVLGGSTAVIVGLVIMAIGGIITIVLMALGSNPAGARFDAKPMPSYVGSYGVRNPYYGGAARGGQTPYGYGQSQSYDGGAPYDRQQPYNGSQPYGQQQYGVSGIPAYGSVPQTSPAAAPPYHDGGNGSYGGTPTPAYGRPAADYGQEPYGNPYGAASPYQQYADDQQPYDQTTGDGAGSSDVAESSGRDESSAGSSGESTANPAI